MRKRVMSQDATTTQGDWLDLERLVQVEVSSEEEAHPIEAALVPGAGSGWRAAEPGEGRVRLLFDAPQKLSRIRLSFHVEETRTQEFVLRWAPEGKPYKEITRQQYNFSPNGATRELEEYQVNLEGVSALELVIIPDISRGSARASLEELRLA